MDSLLSYRNAADSRVSQVADEIISFVATNGLRPGDKLLSESQLSENLNLSKTSVRECISRLNNIGLIHSVQGKGLILNEVSSILFQAVSSSGYQPVLEVRCKGCQKYRDLRILIETRRATILAIGRR